ncbi:hypothetical protein [Psychrobacter sp. I-STPA6b]|uniref:hypothetical protein n=1 Tax=Psychrobacter sp. I-STPA6b TaxID=2585718 RepID=UPI001D0C4FA5|nr:hypothetical protein [Psychrobacter sp. I-STPA6b]
MEVTAQWILSKLVPPTSPHAEVLQGFIAKLISTHSDYSSNLTAMYGDALSKINHHNKLTSSQCQDIINKTTSEGMTEVWAVSYMLALFTQYYIDDTSDNPRQDEGLDTPEWRFMSGYLQTMFLLTARNDQHFKKVNQLGVRVRMGLKPSNMQAVILKKMIEIHGRVTTLNQIFSELETYEVFIKQQEAEGKNNALGNKVGQIRLAYEVIVKDLDFISKKGGGQRGRAKTNKLQVQTNMLSHLDNNASPVRTWHPLITDTSNVSLAEIQSDEDAPKLLDNAFKPSKKTAKSAELQRWEVRNQARHSRRNQFTFPSNPRVLSLMGYQQVFATLWLRLDELELSKKRSCTVILLSMLSGRSITDLIIDLQLPKGQRRILAHHSNEVFIKVVIDVTSNTRDTLKNHRQSFDNNLKLALPSTLEAIINFKFEIDSQEVDDLISSIKKDLRLPLLSRQHIESALAFIITHQLGEPLHADMITGVDVKHSAPLYYTSISSKSLMKTYQSGISLLSANLTQKQQSDFIYDLSYNSNKPYIGSDMVLNTKVCQQFFKKLTNHVEQYNYQSNYAPDLKSDLSIAQFNAYGLWLWHVLQLLTGIRPVNDAPGFLNQFNFTANLLWVSDKANKDNSREGRLIPLADFVVTAVQNYVAYLQRFASKHNMIYAQYPLAIDNILQSKQPLLTFFTFNPLGFIAYKPSRVQSLLGKFLRHQDNWLRHQLRSLLTNRADETLICAVFGHEHPEQEMMHPFSSASMKDLKHLKVQLDNIVKEMNLIQVEVV